MPATRSQRLARRTPLLAPSVQTPSPRELPSDPIRDNSSDDAHLVMPQSQIQSIDDAPNADLELRPRARIFPLDDDGDEVLDEEMEVNHVAPRPRKRHREQRRRHAGLANGFKGVDSLLANRTKAIQNEEPSFPVVKRRRSSRNAVQDDEGDGVSDDRLHQLISKCKTAEEVAEVKAASATAAGRRKLQALRESSSEDDEDSPPVKRRTTRRTMRQGARTNSPPKTRVRSLSSVRSGELSDDNGDGDDTDSSAQVIPSKRRKKPTSQLRRSKMRQTTLKSVPLPKTRGSLSERLKSRGSVPSVPESTRPPSRVTRASAAARRQARARDRPKNERTRKRGRLRWAAASDSEQELDGDSEEPEAADSDYSDEVEEEITIMEEEVIDDDDEEVSEDSLFEEPEPEARTRNKRRKSFKKNNRRRRTRPKNAFESNDRQLSAREQRQRLDFLVQQSADIAKELHKAMAEAATKRPSAASRSPSRKGGSHEKDGDEKTKEAPPEQLDDVGGSDAAPKEEKFAPPNAEGKELQPHQTDGVNWLLTLDAQGLNAILADEMGLGKTIQAVAFLASLVISGKRGPHLVIAPKNVCEHWAAEVRAWYPGQINVVTHVGLAEERLENLNMILEEDNFDILVTSFEIALRDLFTRKRVEGISAQYSRVLRAFRNLEFEYLVVDEAHRLKNDSSRLNIGIRNYECAQRRLLLTGTPLSNDLKELWCLMNVLNPKIFSSKATFEAWFAAPFEAGKGSRKGLMTAAEKSVIVDRLHTILRPFFRRRVRADVCPSFTSAGEILIRCPMSQLQRALMLHFRRRADDKDASKNNILMAMRGVSSHPFISSHALYDGEINQSNATLVSNCGKFAFLHYSLPRLLAAQHRVLIFSQFRRALDFLEDLMDLLNISYGRLDGLTTSEDRISGLRAFNAPGSKQNVFLLSTRAGGVGLNLQTADTVILFDSDWNPSADLQAVSRIQRIGQKKPVHIMRLFTENSVDSIILETSKRKLRTQALAVGAGRFNTSSGAALDQKMRQKDLERLLQELDIKDFLPIDTDERKESVPDSQRSPESLSPNRTRSPLQAQYFKEWSKQLLRPGESELPEGNLTEVWIDSVNDLNGSHIPVWLGKDANLVAAGKAIECMNRASADHVYEETLQSIARVGTFSKKDRASRARRNVVIDLGSDLESDGVSEGDPSVSIEECSDVSEDEEFVPEYTIETSGMVDLHKQFSQIFPPADATQHNASENQAPAKPVVPIEYPTVARNFDPSVKPDITDRYTTNEKKKQDTDLPHPRPASPGGALQTGKANSSGSTPDVIAVQSSNPSKKIVQIAPSPSDSQRLVSRMLQQSLKKEHAAAPDPRAPISHEYYVGQTTGFLQTVWGVGSTVGLPNIQKSVAQPIMPVVAVPSAPGRSKGTMGTERATIPIEPGLAAQSGIVPALALCNGSSTPRYSDAGKVNLASQAESATTQKPNAKGIDARFSSGPAQGPRLAPANTTRVIAGVVPERMDCGLEDFVMNCDAPRKLNERRLIPQVHRDPGASCPKQERTQSRPQQTTYGENGLISGIRGALGRAARASKPVRLLPRAQPPLSNEPNPLSIGMGPAKAKQSSEILSTAIDLGQLHRSPLAKTVQRASASVNASAVPQSEISAQEHYRKGGLIGDSSAFHADKASDTLSHTLSPTSFIASDGVDGTGHLHVNAPANKQTLQPVSKNGLRTARRVAPRQAEEADQGSPRFSRNPRTIAKHPKSSSGARKALPLSLNKSREPDRLYSTSGLEDYVKSLGNGLEAIDIKAESFGNLVKRLQDATKVNDIDFLTDALLECRCRLDDAADYIYDRIS